MNHKKEEPAGPLGPVYIKESRRMIMKAKRLQDWKSKRLKIKEEDGLHKEWYEEVENIRNKKQLDEFIRKMVYDYDHDYGTIIHAMTAAAIATMKYIMRSKQGGITGFQAQCITIQFLREWGHYLGPFMVLDYRKMLYPQNKNNFQKVISKKTWEYLQEQAKIEDKKVYDCNTKYKKHIKSIIAGKVPFGYKIGKE